MLDHLHVRNCYVPMEKYPHLPATATVNEAFKLMHRSLNESNFRTILVHDEDNHLQGYLSLRDLVRAVGPDYLHKSKPDIKGHQPFQGIPQDFSALALIWQEGFTVKIKEAGNRPVGEVMTLIEHTVSLDDPFAKCACLMLIQDAVILPVVDDTRVVGVVRLVDIFETIAKDLSNN